MTTSQSERADAVCVKVSVVVPVYNPGPYMDEGIASLLAQTLRPGEFEAIFVDDGSTDDAPDRLDRLAAKHPHFHVIHIPNSGWPGRPRNVGTDAACGEYVQYMDQDDRLAPDALRRLYDLGRRNNADIVIGKVASNFRPIPTSIWQRTHESVTIHDVPLWTSLTPHKMFRRGFLQEHQIRFPEGKRRLEDQLFMMKAYFPARAVSILGDYTCYYYWRREDKKHAGFMRIDPHGYYDNLREVLEVVEENTDPGAFRDLILSRFYRVEMLNRLRDEKWLRYSPEYRRKMFTSVRECASAKIPPTVRSKLPAVLRLRSTLLLEDRQDDLTTFARRCQEVQPLIYLNKLEWKDGALHVRFTAELRHGPGREQPFVLVHTDDRDYVDPTLTEGLLDWRLGDVTAKRGDARVLAVLRSRETATEWTVPVRRRVHVETLGPDTGSAAAQQGTRLRVSVQCNAQIDPTRLEGGDRLARGVWDLRLRIMMFGFDRRVPLGADRAEGAEEGCLPALVGTPPTPVVPFLGSDGNLSIDVDRKGRTLAMALEGRTVLAGTVQRGQLELALPVACLDVGTALQTRAVLRRQDGAPGDGEHAMPAYLTPVNDRAHLVVDLKRDVTNRLVTLEPGRWRLSGLLDRDCGPETELVTVEIDHRARIAMPSVPRLRSGRLVRRTAGAYAIAVAARRRLRRTAVRVRVSLQLKVRRLLAFAFKPPSSSSRAARLRTFLLRTASRNNQHSTTDLAE